MTSAREDLGYVAPAAPPSAPPRLPELTHEQLRTLRRVQKGSLLDRKVWTLLCMGELARMKLIAPNSERNERWIVTPLGVELLERTKGRQT